ncbi:MAG: hypothetical protein COB83_00555 [Gammaproteobacteria bacterium]|nr:MAG: hypothetical protein COB83_00555 [Gammaproteobacteria bacterium]
MIDIKQFSALQKKSKNSFASQRQLMKKVMAGQTVHCSVCKEPLSLFTPGSNDISGIRCKKGCTDIQLDFA